MDLDHETEPADVTPGVVDTDARTPLGANTELRNRMRLRLAMNGSRATLAHTPRDAAQQPASDVGHMVWNSVLEPRADSAPSLAPAALPTLVPARLPTIDPGQSLAQMLAAAVAAPSLTVVDPPAAEPVVVAPVIAEPVVMAPVVAGPAAVEAPVELPTIVAATPLPTAVEQNAAVPLGVIVPSIPVLSQPSRAAAAVRPAQPLTDQSQPAPARRVAHQTQRRAPTSTRRRRPFRAFLLFLIVAGLLGGAAYAGWYTFLRDQVTWSADVAPLAEFVEVELGSTFTESVDVETLTVAEYEIELGLSVISRSYADSDGRLMALRAVGVAGATTSATDVGRIVAGVRSSFYSPADRTIYRTEGATALSRSDMVRSLAEALADQRLRWSSQLGELSDSQQVAMRLLVDGVARRAVVAHAESDVASAEQANVEMVARFDAVGLAGDQIPLYVVTAIAPIFTPVRTYPSPPPETPLEGLDAPTSDAALFDLTRDPRAAVLTAPLPAGATIAARTLGMQFWYEAMVPALGADAARSAAVLWAGDSSVVTDANGFACINANIVTANDADHARFSEAMMQWGLARPASSAAVISTQPGNITSVSMCEPAEGSVDALAGLSAIALHEESAAEAEVAEALIHNGLPETREAWNCAVLARRGGTLANYEPGTVDPAVVKLMHDVTAFCGA